MLTLIALICAAIVAVGCFAAIFEMLAVRAFARAQEKPFPSPPGGIAAEVHSQPSPGVTIFKPLHGAEFGLFESLMTFATQDYPGPVQMVFGVADPDDAAVLEVHRLQRQHPARDIELVVSPAAQGGNAKIANMTGMSAAIKHSLVVISDSDIQVAPDYLRRTVFALQQPGVGLATCLYRGEATGGPWSLLSAMAIDYHFFPSVLLGLRVGRGRPCVGATMALRKETLAEIGGFEAFATVLADDHAIGEAVRRTGQCVEVPAHLVTHRCVEQSARQLLQHELRAARTIRGIDPWGFAGSFVMHPLPFALAAAALRGFDAVGSALLLITLGCRLGLQWQVDRTMRPQVGLCAARLALGPARDILSFVVFCASFCMNAVVWRGRRYRIRRDGTMVELKGSSS